MTWAFLNYGLQNNRIVIKEMFGMTPESHAVAYREFLNTTKRHKIIIPTDKEVTGQVQPLRILFYRDLGAEILPPLSKNTGFETLKMHLAKETGVYNQYDLTYRYPLEQLLMNEEWYLKLHRRRFKRIISPNLNAIRQEFEDFCKSTPDIKSIELYKFIL
jgi:hypothetical protein